MILEEYLNHYRNNDIENMKLSASSYLKAISNIDDINIDNIKERPDIINLIRSIIVLLCI